MIEFAFIFIIFYTLCNYISSYLLFKTDLQVTNVRPNKRTIRRGEACDLGSVDDLTEYDGSASLVNEIYSLNKQKGPSLHYSSMNKTENCSSVDSIYSQDYESDSSSFENNNSYISPKFHDKGNRREYSFAERHSRLNEKIKSSRKIHGISHDYHRLSCEDNHKLDPNLQRGFKKSYLTHEETLKIIDSIWPLNSQSQSLPCTPRSRIDCIIKESEDLTYKIPHAAHRRTRSPQTELTNKSPHLTYDNVHKRMTKIDDTFIKRSNTSVQKPGVCKVPRSFDSNFNYKSEISVFRSPLKSRYLVSEEDGLRNISHPHSQSADEQILRNKLVDLDFIDKVFHSWDKPSHSKLGHKDASHSRTTWNKNSSYFGGKIFILILPHLL